MRAWKRKYQYVKWWKFLFLLIQADEEIDKVVKEAISKPWLPLPLGLKPPSTESVLSELSKQGISTVPSHINGSKVIQWKFFKELSWGSHHVHKEYQKKNPIGLWALPLSVAADLDHLIFHHLICKKEREKRQVEPKTKGGTCRLTWELWCTVLVTMVRWRTEWTVEEEPRRWLWYHNFEVWLWRWQKKEVVVGWWVLE